MPVDPTGTKPGLQHQVEEPKVHNMRCKNKDCDSMQVSELNVPGNAGRHIYRCIKCNTTWSVTTGGGVEFGG